MKNATKRRRDKEKFKAACLAALNSGEWHKEDRALNELKRCRSDCTWAVESLQKLASRPKRPNYLYMELYNSQAAGLLLRKIAPAYTALTE